MYKYNKNDNMTKELVFESWLLQFACNIILGLCLEPLNQCHYCLFCSINQCRLYKFWLFYFVMYQLVPDESYSYAPDYAGNISNKSSK